ncbi:sugar phosphate isomerase/epimerase [bacterium]|nr:sugar phosphate isomerase/epimerase [bacterium]
MDIYISSSVEKSIQEAAKLAEKLCTNLEISRFPNMDYIDSNFEYILKEMKNSVKDFQGKISLHALFSDLNPASKDYALREIAKKRYQQSFEAALATDAKNMVFHSGHKGMKHKVSVQNYLEGSIKFWKEYIKQFEDKGIIASIENVLEDSPKNLITIVDEVNSPNLKICLDTGHANLCSDIPISEWIKTYGKRLHHMHWHNNYKTNDDHSSLKNGTVNFLDIWETLRNENL